MSRHPTQPPPLPAAVIAYQSPYAPAGPVSGVWKAANLVVAAKEAVLPCRCIKCNTPVDAARGLRKTYTWHEPTWYLLILAGLLVYVIVALIVSKKGVVTFYLCPQHRKQRLIGILMGSILVPAGLIGLIGGAANENGLIAIGGIVAFIAGIIGIVKGTVFKPTKIDDHYVWLKGACPEFVETLPSVAA